MTIRLLFNPIAAFILIPTIEPYPKPIPYMRPPVPVANTALQNPVEERGPLDLGLGRVAPDEGEHGVLHDVQGVLVIMRRDLRDPEGAALDSGQESIQYLAVIQGPRPPLPG